MILLSLLTSTLWFTFLYAISFLVGYAFCITFQIRLFFNKKFDVISKFVVYEIIGLVVLVVLLFGFAFIAISPFFLTITVFSLIAIIYRIHKNRSLLKSYNLLKPNCLEILIFIIILLLSIGYLDYAVSFLGWPPPGDIMNRHGPMVSLLEYQKKMPQSLYPLASVPIDYPLGYHVLTAFFNTLWNVYPGQAVLITGGALAALTPLLLYAITFANTKSIILSIIAYFSAFFIDPSGNMERWVMGFFFNGPYSCLFAFVLVIGIVAVFSCLDMNSNGSKSGKQSLIILGLWTVVALILVYPSFAFLYLPFFVVKASSRELSNLQLRRFFKKPKRRWIGLYLNVIFLFLVIILASYVYSSLMTQSGVNPIDPNSSWNTGYSIGYMIPYEEFFSISVLCVLVAVPIAIYDLVKKSSSSVSMFFLISVLMVTASYVPYLSSYASLVFPSRSFVILTLFSWILILKFFDWIKEKVPIKITFQYRHRLSLSNSGVVFIVAIMAFLFLSPSLTAHFSGNVLYTSSWFFYSENFADDFAALQWINEHVSEEAYILNDRSYVSYFLLSMSIKNVTFSRYSARYGGKTPFAMMKIWENPLGVSIENAEMVEGSNSADFWNRVSSWGTGNIGTPEISRYNESLWTTISIPNGQNKCWGLWHDFDEPLNWNNYNILLMNVQSTREIGVSVFLESLNARTTRYDIKINEGSSQVSIYLLNPNAGDANLTAIKSIGLATGWNSPQPESGDLIILKGLYLSIQGEEVKKLLKEYNVKYILVTSEWGYKRDPYLDGDSEYVPKLYSVDTYISIFDTYDFLKICFERLRTRVYEVT